MPGVTISGDPATVYVNRQYLLKAIGFGLRTIGVQEPLKPLRFSDGGSRQMIVMPVRVDANASTPSTKAPAPTPVSPITPAASTDAAPDQPTTINPNHNQPEERNHHTHAERNHQPPTATGTSPRRHRQHLRTRGENPAWSRRSTRSSSSRAPCAAAVTNLNSLADTLRQVQRERRLSEREVRSVRDTLKTLQTVRL